MGTLILRHGEIKEEFYDVNFNDVDLYMFDLKSEDFSNIIYSDLGKGRFLKGGNNIFITSFPINQLFEYV